MPQRLYENFFLEPYNLNRVVMEFFDLWSFLVVLRGYCHACIGL
ncbi:hypothetical protein DSUL_60207 [Desulfovibrionales bacterium]